MKTTNEYGLTERDMQTLLSILGKYDEVQKVVLFGSRAKSSYHSGSDIDIAIIDKNVSYGTLRRIKDEISDSSLPYNVDLVNYSTLTNQELKEHIRRAGKLFFRN